MPMAPSKTDLILKQIKELPPLPLVVQKLIKVMDDEMSSAEDISRVLSSDQAMASKVLKLVNSSFYGLSGQVSTVSRAVVILGVAAIRNLALGLAVAKIMATGEKNDMRRRFWEHALATAAGAEILARAGGYPDPEEAFMAGLLHDLGYLVLLMAVPEESLELIENPVPDQLEKEKEMLGLTHAQVGQKLLKHWRLPRQLEQAVRFHHTGPVFTSGDEPLASLVAMADALAAAHGSLDQNNLSHGEIQELIGITGLDLAGLPETLGDIGRRMEETQLFLQIATDGEVEVGTTAVAWCGRVALVCTHPGRTRWSQQLLAYYGHETVPMRDYFAQAAAGRLPDLVILDPEGVTDQQLARMAPVLRLPGQRLVVMCGHTAARATAALGICAPCLPAAFSRQDLEDLFSD